MELPKKFEQVDQWKTMLFLYESALKEINTKIEILNQEFVHVHNYNPIEHVKSRIKSAESIVRKLKKLGFEATIDNMMKHLNDIAGIRIICSFTSDIYQIAKMIANQDDVMVLQVKDYMKHPKPNGYKSYHMVVSLPIFLSDGPVHTTVEIQIRTIAMDFWASLDHQLKYKKQLDEFDAAEIGAQLKECAEIIAGTDWRMLDIRRRIEDKGFVVDNT